MEPKLRVTQRKALNDPFELLPQASQVSDLYERIFGYAKKSGHDVSMFEGIRDAVNNSEKGIYEYTALMDRYGIISLSERCDDILMWSHYANDHKGLCVGIDSDFLAEWNDVCHSSRNDKKSVQPIIYSKHRSVSDKGTQGFEHFFDCFFVKSKGWCYEKEFRVVCEVNNSSEIIISKAGVDALRKNGYDDNFLISPTGEGKYKINFSGVVMEKGDDKFYGSLEVKGKSVEANALSVVAQEPCSVFLKKLPKEAIKEVVFGCQAPSNIVGEIVEELQRWFFDVEILKAVKDAEDFKINIEKYK